MGKWKEQPRYIDATKLIEDLEEMELFIERPDGSKIDVLEYMGIVDCIHSQPTVEARR